MDYAILNPDTGQMLGAPLALPQRWITPDGVTIGNFNKLPRATLAALHWLPVEYDLLPSPCTHRYAAYAVYDAGNARFVYRAEAIALETLQTEACAAIDAAASSTSARHMTVGVGMELRYMSKALQARDCVSQLAANPDTDPWTWPLVAAEAEAVGESVMERAQVILAASSGVESVLSEIEAARIGGKTAVRRAAVAEDVIAARDAALATLEAI